ncbi:CDP-glycerol glycerophosphotransferase family protein [Bacillus pseudomycoides]|uniref:CDP-glycerol glycerophosphotransferase family protein n=1 Tax=Bacillus pseudomycoides TaxID=64104 RepID=UPI0011A195E7|nr:CDP-glycerol glycerophosphotransferase family protein [Bacillus pseudomycoides]
MIREISVEIYLILFKILHSIMKIFPVKRKVTFIMSYGENLIFIYDEMKRKKIDCEVIFLYKSTCKYEVDSYSNVKSFKFETKNILHTIKSIYHLSTSQYVIIDNYFGSLAKVKFKKGVQCIQIWHAAGAIKKFGLLAPSFNKRSLRAQKRFLDVYRNFHKIVVGSDALASIYKDAFGLSDDKILKTGIPRTDLFFYEQRKREIKDNILLINPTLKSKKIILYAPTFRDKELLDFDLHLDMEAMYKALKDEYIVLIKLHPAVRNKLEYKDKYTGFLYDYSLYPNINDLFLVTDILVTDYSSVPFEFCLLNKPMVFFSYDLKKYTKKRGIIGDYTTTVPGSIVYNTSELIQVIKSNSFDMEVLKGFKLKWNKYSQGNSSEKLVNYLFNREV